MKKYILAIDAGTTSSRAVLFDKHGAQIGIAQHEFTQYFPKEGWVEHNPEEIWETQLQSIQDVMKHTGIAPDEIDSIGITNQRETTVIWDRKTGKPVYNAIVWQDRRTASMCEQLTEQGATSLFQKKTGLVIDAYFSGTKIKWIMDNDPTIRRRAQNGELAFGTIDTWLIWKLTNGQSHVTDVTNASRTLIYNIHNLKWDDELLELLTVPRSLLPNVVASSEIVTTTAVEIMGTAIPIAGIAGDQQAALFGQLCTKPGDVKNTYGTGCFCIMNTGSRAVVSKNRMLTTIAWKLGDEVIYALEGTIFAAGALVQWLRDNLGIIETAAEVEALANTVENNGGVTFVPALAGLAAPYWDPHATGAIMGITRGTQKGHIARAALEAIALRSAEIIIEMQKDAEAEFKTLKVDGGACTNNLLMQIQANLLQKEVVRPRITETTAMGAAFFAGLATGFWPSENVLQDLWQMDRKFTPQPDTDSRDIVSNWSRRISKIADLAERRGS